MKRIKTAGVVCGTMLVLSLLMARAHPFGNAGMYGPVKRQGPLMAGTDITPEAQAILTEKCAQCHSNESRPPFYGYFAPVSWMVEKHILEGRQKLNFDEWNSYSEDQQQLLKAKIVQTTKTRRMPIKSYLLIHWSARITDADVKALTVWAHRMPLSEQESAEPAVPAPAVKATRVAATPVTGTPGVARVVALAKPSTKSQDKTADEAAQPASPPTSAAIGSVTPVLLEADATRGEAVFERRCTGCHVLDVNRDGPKMRGVYGHMSAEVPGFDYSDALKQAHIRWDDVSLEKWLADPDSLVPDNNMDYRVAKEQDRLDLIRYLKESAQ